MKRRQYTYKQILTKSYKYGGVCVYCGSRVVIGKTSSVDHYLPICQGGNNSKHNTVLACRECNSRKRGRTLLQWVLQDTPENIELVTTFLRIYEGTQCICDPPKLSVRGRLAKNIRFQHHYCTQCSKFVPDFVRENILIQLRRIASQEIDAKQALNLKHV